MDKNEIRQIIAKRAAMELHDGDIVNLGIGIPTMIPNFLPEGVTVRSVWVPPPKRARKTRT